MQPRRVASLLKGVYFFICLISAPRKWYADVDSAITLSCRMERLRSDNASHVDAFLLSGKKSPSLEGSI